MTNPDHGSTAQLERTLHRLAGPPTALSDEGLHRAGLKRLRRLRFRRRAAAAVGVLAVLVGSQAIFETFQSTERIDVATPPPDTLVVVEAPPLPSPDQLLDAVRSDDTLSVLAILEAGAEVDATERLELTPLMVAAIRNNVEVARILLDVGADVHLVSEPGYRVTHLAAQYGDREMIELLAEHGADVDAASPRIGEVTPLMLAARVGNRSALDALLDVGASHSMVDAYGRNALSYAFDSPTPEETIDRLIDAGAILAE